MHLQAQMMQQHHQQAQHLRRGAGSVAPRAVGAVRQVVMVKPGRGHPAHSRRAAPCRAAGRNESMEQTKQRRMLESAQVDDRVVLLHGMADLKQRLAEAGSKLVVLELQGEECQSGLQDEPELHWKLDQESAARKRQEACLRVKHAFQRTARECPDVVFLEMLVPEDHEGEAIKSELGVRLVPSVLFFRQGELLWQQEGFDRMEQELGEGVLYYGDVAGGGVKASEYVKELGSRQQLDEFLSAQPHDRLTVVNVSTSLCTPCVKVYPAVLALARNFAGQASFARLLADEVDDPDTLMRGLRILEVPTFIFFRGGREVGRHVGSSRGDLIGQILKVQAEEGIRPPTPVAAPGGVGGRARRTSSAASTRR